MRYLVALLCVALAACSDSTGPGAETHVGVYTLRTVNGQGLPFTLAQVGSDKIEVTAERLTVNADGTFSGLTTYRVTEAGRVSIESDTWFGTYQLRGTNVTFTDSEGFTGAGAYVDGVLTLSVEGFTFLYRK